MRLPLPLGLDEAAGLAAEAGGLDFGLGLDGFLCEGSSSTRKSSKSSVISQIDQPVSEYGG